MPYELSVTTEFSAAHFLRGYDGDCARLHGHNWRVKLTVTADSLNELGIAIDYKRLKQELKAALADWDHYNLNDIPPFDRINPSSEAVARELFGRMRRRLRDEGVRVAAVEIGETCATRVCYRE
ncbi:MAG: 6-carboxytetrahydropterin synthase QueD [Zetaproteobacteria bacterium]|nr:MAG: 6-carboxytetrahydropterin synthase QueD [Zetaproteobacteria bacterium]